MEQVQKAPQQFTGYESSDEIDLVDLIGFLWRIRAFILAGILVGTVASVGTAILRKQGKDVLPTQVATYMIPLGEDASGSTLLDKALPTDLRLTKINQMLASPETLRIFLGPFAEKGIALSADLKGEALFQWFLSQQKNDSEKQRIAYVSSLVDGRILFTGKWSARAEPAQIAETVREGLNRMIGKFNTQAGQALELRKKLLFDQNLELVNIRSQLSAILFRLAAKLGPIHPLTASLITGGESLDKTKTTDADLGRIVRILGLLEHEGKLAPSQIDAEKKHVAALQAAYQALSSQESSSTDAPSKTQSPKIGFLLPFTVTPANFGSHKDNLSTVDVAPEPASFKSNLNKSMPLMITLGILLGGFLGIICGAMRQFWLANRARIRSALAS